MGARWCGLPEWAAGCELPRWSVRVIAKSPGGSDRPEFQPDSALSVLITATSALASFGTTSPLKSSVHAAHSPFCVSHLTVIFAGSNSEFMISATDSYS